MKEVSQKHISSWLFIMQLVLARYCYIYW